MLLDEHENLKHNILTVQWIFKTTPIYTSYEWKSILSFFELLLMYLFCNSFHRLTNICVKVSNIPGKRADYQIFSETSEEEVTWVTWGDRTVHGINTPLSIHMFGSVW